jgi:hypothetical protein
MQIVALEPPGNVARELALFRRELFHRLGEGSALAFPEMVPLAYAPPPVAPIPRGSAARRLAECWGGIEGSFSAAGLQLEGGLLYLSMKGPIAELSARVAAAFGPDPSPGGQALAPGIGVFLCRPSDPGLALREAGLMGAPRADFRDCSLTLLGIQTGADPFSAAVWRELARAKRRTGV